MKKLLLSIVAVASMISAATADTFDVTFTTEDGWNSVNSYTSSSSSTKEMGGSTWTTQNFNNNNNGWGFIKAGSKNFTSVASIFNNTPLEDKLVSSVAVTVDKVTTSKINSATLYMADDINFTDPITLSYTQEMNAGTWIFNIPSPAANKFYKFTVDCAKGSSNGLIQISKLTFTYMIDDPMSVFPPSFSQVSGWVEKGTAVSLSCASEGAEIYYTTNGDVPTKTSTKYEAPVAVNENMTISAIAYVGDNASEVVTAEYKVYELNDESTPLTVAEANAWIADGKPSNVDVFVKGIVVKITQEVNTQYGNASYLINDEAGVTDGALEVYRGKYFNGENFTATDQIAVGMNVLLKGYLKDYNGTKEFDANSQIVKIYNAPAQPEVKAEKKNSSEDFVKFKFTAQENCTIWYKFVAANGDQTRANEGYTEYVTGEVLQLTSGNDLEAYAVDNTTGFRGESVKMTYDAVVATDVISIEAEENGKARYFNLQGVEVSEPAHGIFVRVQNGKAVKVVR